jgi:hypothetical protein
MKTKLLLAAFPGILASFTSLTAAVFTWDGGDTGNAWEAGDNWVGDAAPANATDTDIIFAEAAFAGASQAIFTSGYDIASISFNDSITSPFTVNTNPGSHTMEVDAITVDSGVGAGVFLGGRYIIGSGGTVITNNSGFTVAWEGNLFAAGTGQVQLRNGDFVTSTGSANNSTWTGGTLIDDALWRINAAITGGQTDPFGAGDLVFGDAASTANATLQIQSLRGTTNNFNNNIVVNSSDSVLDIDLTGGVLVQGDIALTSGSQLTVDNGNSNTFLNGAISGTGDLVLGTAGGIMIVDNTNTFTGNVTINTTTQIRASTGGLGNASNLVTVDGGAFRLFSAADGSVTLDNELNLNTTGGNIGVQGGGTATNVTGTFNGDWNLGADMTQLDVVATANGAQNITLNVNGAIVDSNPAGTDVFIDGAGAAGSDVTVNLAGESVFAGSTTTNNTGNLGDLLVNLDGSLSNSNLTIGAGTEFAGSGTLFYNIEGANSDLITVNGTFDISGLTLDFDLSGLGATESSYLIADYSAGTLVGSTFLDIVDLPSGFSIDYNLGGASQIGIVIPEPSSFALLAGLLGLTSVMLRRRSR